MSASEGAAPPRTTLEAPEDDRLAYAEVLVEIGELDEAEREVTRALEERPENLPGVDLLAKIKHMRGEISEAIACWGHVHDKAPREQAALLRLSSVLQLAREAGRGPGTFVALGPFQLWKKPAVQLELESAFRLFLEQRPDEARARCEELARKYRSRDADVYKLAVLANAWIAELSGDLEGARSILESFGRDRGFETDTDRVIALARIYEQVGTPELLEKAVNVWLHFLRQHEKVSVLGHLAALSRRLRRTEDAARYERLFLALFRKRAHRPSYAEVIAVAARRYVPLFTLAGVRFRGIGELDDARPRARAVARALAGDHSGARSLLEDDPDALALKYRADLDVLEGRFDDAVGLYLESLEKGPEDLRVTGWLLSHRDGSLPPRAAAYFARPEVASRTLAALQAALATTPREPSLWRQLGALRGLLGQEGDRARCDERASVLEAAAARRRSPVGRVLAAAAYNLLGKPRGIVHEVWADRRPAPRGQGGFLGEILGNITPEMTQAVRNTFLSVREYARAKWPGKTADILDFTYTYKVTKEDEPSGGLSAGLPTALAFLSVFLDRPVPQTIASSGALVADAHDVLVVRAIGDAEYKVRGAYNRNLARLLLPEANRALLVESPLVPAPVLDEIVAWVSDFDDAVRIAFGTDVWMA